MSLLATISDAIALFFLWLFVTAGTHKLNPSRLSYFVGLITEYGWSNPNTAKFFTRFLGIIEIVLGVGILISSSRFYAAVSAVGLLFFYLLLMAYQLHRGRMDLDCGCSGPDRQLKMSGHLLIRNLILIGLCILCLIPGNPDQFENWMVYGLFAIGAVFFYQSCEQLIGNAQKLKTLNPA